MAGDDPGPRADLDEPQRGGQEEDGAVLEKCAKNVCNSQNYVAHYALRDDPIAEADILSRGREAWDTSLNTVNVGKFNLDWASIGICTHAFYEAIDHSASPRLFDHAVTDFPHIRQFFTDA